MAGRREHIQFQLNPLGGAALSANSPRTEKNRRYGLSAPIAAGEPSYKQNFRSPIKLLVSHISLHQSPRLFRASVKMRQENLRHLIDS